MKLDDYKDKYKKWWIGKAIRFAHRSEDGFSVCKHISVYGCPSGFSHSAELHLEDGSVLHMPIWDEFRPRKKDIEVQKIMSESEG